MYIKNCFNFTAREDLVNTEIESPWIEVKIHGAIHFLLGTMYRPPSAPFKYYRALLDVIERGIEVDR
jgi:hypothetical protein